MTIVLVNKKTGERLNVHHPIDAKEIMQQGGEEGWSYASDDPFGLNKIKTHPRTGQDVVDGAFAKINAKLLPVPDEDMNKGTLVNDPAEDGKKTLVNDPEDGADNTGADNELLGMDRDQLYKYATEQLGLKLHVRLGEPKIRAAIMEAESTEKE